MLFRWTALFCAFAVGALAGDRSSGAAEVKRLDLSNLPPGSRFEIATNDRVYHGEMVDAATGEARLAASLDGKQFTEPPHRVSVGRDTRPFDRSRRADAGEDEHPANRPVRRIGPGFARPARPAVDATGCASGAMRTFESTRATHANPKAQGRPSLGCLMRDLLATGMLSLI